MRPTVKDPVDLWSPLKQGLLRLGNLPPSALRVSFGLGAAAAVVLLTSQWTGGATSSQLVAPAAILVLAYALVDKVFPKHSASAPGRAADAQRQPLADRPAPDEASGEQDPACPAGHVGCWVTNSLQGILSVAKEVAPRADISQAANSLARRACELVDADAAWVYRIEQNGEKVSLISSHLRPREAESWDGLAEQAHRLASGVARGLSRHHYGGNRLPRVSVTGEYTFVPLRRRREAIGMLVVHGIGSQGAPTYVKQDFLASLASQATLSLENTLLYESQRDIQAKLRQFELHRTDYVSTLSHELRTPLTSIKGFAQLLMREQEITADTAREYASTIAAEADKLSLIVNDVVDLTRMETGLLEMNRSPLALGRLIRTVVLRLQPMMSLRQLQVSLPERLPPVRVDAGRLDQALGRLLVDAVGQSSPGSTILLAAEAGDDGVTVRLEYRATEARIESLAEALKGLGQPNGDGQATQLGRGRLGLYICRNFIEAHGGKMWAESPEEQILRVVFTLPY